MNGAGSNRGYGRPTLRIGAHIAALLAMLGGTDASALDCLVSATGVAFGVYDVALATPTDSVGSLTVRCVYQDGGATRVSYTVALSTGNSGTYAQRQMRSGTSTLNYNLFDSATYARMWGNGTAGSALMSGSLIVNRGNFATNEAVHPIYGRIPAQQSADSGTYSDQVLVTLTF
jgi:spore coat protein U-like protein